MENETLETETPETEGVETPETPAEENPEEKSKELQSAIAQKEHFRSKSEKLQAELEALKGVPKTEKPEEWVASTDPLEIVRLGKSLKDYSESETEFIIRNSTTKDIDGIMKAERDPMVQIAIQASREKVARENKIPEPSSPSAIPGERNQQEIAKMTKEEHRAYVEDMVKRMPIGRGGGT